MFDPNAQNDLLRLKTELNDCVYGPQMRDWLSNLIIRIMNYPKKQGDARHFVKMFNHQKLMMIWYQMSVPFMNRNYNVPLQIYLMKNFPYEPPQIFLEISQGSAANANNKDIDPRNNRIMTYTLKSWNQNSNLENVLNEIYESFSRTFPLYKKKPNQQAPPQGQNQGPSGGIYGMLKNEAFNLYQKNRLNFNNNQNSNQGFQPPARNIYGRAMTIEGDRKNNNIYNNNYNNQQQPNSFGGGIYGDKNQQQPNYGGGFYGNNNNNNQQPQTFGGGIYGNNNNNQQQPKSFGGGIYGNDNNQGNPNQQGGGQYNYNNNNQNQYGGMYNQGGYNAPPPPQPKENPDEEFKNILINEISNKISNKLIEEKKRLDVQNNKMKEYKKKFSKENEILNNFVNGQNQIKLKCEEDMSNMNNAIKKIQDYINHNKAMMLNQENCVNYLDLPDSEALKIIADETSLEELILVVKKGFERKKIPLDKAIEFTRNSSRDLFAIKFLKEKVINKYRY